MSSSPRPSARAGAAPGVRAALERVLARVPPSGSAGEAWVEVERLLADPGWLADSATLPLHHPWRAHGRLARDLLTRVVTGPLDENDREALRGIPRRSPVAAWSLTVRLLDAAYAGRGADALAIAERVPEISPARAIADVVAALLRGDDAPPRGREAARLHDKLLPLPETCRRRTREMNDALAAGDKDLAFAAARALHARLRAAAPHTMGELRAVLALELAAPDTDPLELAELLAGFGDRPAAYQQMALVYERMSPEIASYGWFEYLAHRCREPIPESERVAVMRRLFALVAPHEFAERTVPEPLLCGLGARRSDERLSRLPMRRALQECLLDANPTPETHRVLLEHARDDEERERLATSWSRHCPDDSEPSFLLARLLKRRDPRRALGHLETAAGLGHDPVRVERLGFELAVACAEESIRRGKGAQTLADLERLGRLDPRQPTAWRVHVLALGWLAHAIGGRSPKLRRAWSELVRVAGDEGTAALWVSAYPRWFAGQAVERAWRAAKVLAPDGGDVLRSLALACRWAAQLERPFESCALEPDVVRRAFREHGAALGAEDLLTLADHAERRLRDDADEPWADVAFALAARGLEGEERSRARFLALRAAWLAASAERADLALECDLVATFLAERWGDRELVRALCARSFESGWFEESRALAERHAAAILARERRRTEAPRAHERCLVDVGSTDFDPEALDDPFDRLSPADLRERIAPFAGRLLDGTDVSVLREVSEAFVREGFHVPSLERLRELATQVLHGNSRGVVVPHARVGTTRSTGRLRTRDRGGRR